VAGSAKREVEEEWKAFREGIVSSAKEVCGVRKLGAGGKRKGSEWWNEEVKQLVKEKKEAFNRYMQSREDRRWEEYKRKCKEVKRKVREEKRRADERWGEKISRNFRENKKQFWKEVNNVRRVREEVSEVILGTNEEVLEQHFSTFLSWRNP